MSRTRRATAQVRNRPGGATRNCIRTGNGQRRADRLGWGSVRSSAAQRSAGAQKSETASPLAGSDADAASAQTGTDLVTILLLAVLIVLLLIVAALGVVVGFLFRKLNSRSE